jgi:hypothetical protein
MNTPLYMVRDHCVLLVVNRQLSDITYVKDSSIRS